MVQFLYMKKIVENLAFDQIYHEHLLYYNLKNIEVLLNRHGLEMFDCKLTPIHGGSMIGFVTHKEKKTKTQRYLEACASENASKSNDIATYHEFAKRVENMKKRDIAYLDQKKKEGKTIFGMGALVKGNTLLNYFGVGKSHLDCLVEKNTLLKGLISLDMHLPVLMESELTATPDVFYVLVWNFKKEILANNKHLIEKGVEFYFPVNAN